jgi:photosystem II stability/assembly factor-like uncharacterized protein
VYGGVYRSVDSAQSWELVLDVSTFMVQTIDINEDGWIYVGRNGENNLMVSKDNGESWEGIDLPSFMNVTKVRCEGHDTVYVGIWENFGALLLRTTDNCITWDTLFMSYNHVSENITDIGILSTGEIYVSVNAFYSNSGGVYKSNDDGITWEYVGLINHQVMALAVNSNDDVFTGDWYTMNNEYPGIYAQYHGINEFELLLPVYQATDIVINNDNHIYVAANESVLQSSDNGVTFEYINDALSHFIEILYLDDQEYLYGANGNQIVKSIQPTITSIASYDSIGLSHNVILFPNPVINILNVELLNRKESTNCKTVCIYDLCGNQCINRTMNITDNHIQIDVSNLKTGIYFISILEGNNKLNSKFIKK